jgi:hypothetical protein
LEKIIEEWTFIVASPLYGSSSAHGSISLVIQDYVNKGMKGFQFHHISSSENYGHLITKVSLVMVMTIKIYVVMYLPWWWYVFFGIISIIARLVCLDQDIG